MVYSLRLFLTSTDRLEPSPEACPVATIVTVARTEPATAVPSRFKITYLNMRWLARIICGAVVSTRVVIVMFRFLKSCSVTP